MKRWCARDAWAPAWQRTDGRCAVSEGSISGGRERAAPVRIASPGGAERSRGASRRARPQDEGRAGRRQRGEAPLLIEHHQAAVEEFADLDPTAHGGASPGAGGNLRPAGAHADGVVVGDAARVATAEEAVEITRRAPP